ncbi:hypothetical protein [Neorhizobium alkalisoli]|uniref:hypothetical protein n=1 Tax=Neorhizobium alkalisoli TaxID=528178 RepID=UPI000CF8F4D4|nr:hypothetical protein [Neorhizobium alkalisoli]
MTSLWVLGVVIFVSLVWSVLPGKFEHELVWNTPGSIYSRALSISFYAFNNYCIPMIVTLALRDAGLQSHRWRNISQSHWTSWLPQAVILVFVSWAVATVFVVGLTLWKTGLDAGWDANEYNVWLTLRRTFEYNAPTPLRGAVLALIVIVLLDAWSSQARILSRKSRRHSSVIWAASSAMIMGMCGGVTRYITSWASKSTATPSLDDIDRGLIFYSAMFSALVGFFVVFCIVEALLHQHSNTERFRGTKTSAKTPKATIAE